MKTFLTAMAAVLAAGQAIASGTGFPLPPASVPEISALEGTAALAALAAIVLFTWERSRRAQ